MYSTCYGSEPAILNYSIALFTFKAIKNQIKKLIKQRYFCKAACQNDRRFANDKTAKKSLLAETKLSNPLLYLA